MVEFRGGGILHKGENIKRDIDFGREPEIQEEFSNNVRKSSFYRDFDKDSQYFLGIFQNILHL